MDFIALWLSVLCTYFYFGMYGAPYHFARIGSAAGKIPVLKAGDVIKDRLAAYFHWRDRPSLVQALAVLVKFPEELQSIAAFCESEGS
jgi:hypothetical protein